MDAEAAGEDAEEGDADWGEGDAAEDAEEDDDKRPINYQVSILLIRGQKTKGDRLNIILPYLRLAWTLVRPENPLLRMWYSGIRKTLTKIR